MRWLLFVVWMVVFAGALGLGYLLGKKNKKAAAATVGLCLVVVLLRLLLRPNVELLIFPFAEGISR